MRAMFLNNEVHLISNSRKFSAYDENLPAGEKREL